MPEINFDTLVGPTHNFSGLSYGNLASMANQMQSSNPQLAALQGLKKMHALHQLGIPQAILPPHERPFLPLLQTVGYVGAPAKIIETVWSENPSLLLAASSSSGMWTANALTICPSSDSEDGKVHFTPANLVTNLHRLPEALFVGSLFKKIFNSTLSFTHHDPLPSHLNFADEGAANHTRLCKSYEKAGIQLFVYGRSNEKNANLLFPARQTLEASQAIARLHKLKKNRFCFARQKSQAIEAGVFHNDVIAVGNQNVFFYHEDAFEHLEELLDTLQNQLKTCCGIDLIPIQVLASDISLNEAVKTYLFNSQIVTTSDQTMVLIAPQECQQSKIVKDYLEQLIKSAHCPIKQVHYFSLKESMQNGGGPACLRLRVALNAKEMSLMNNQILFTEKLYQQLTQWIKTHYRDRLYLKDLADPAFLNENFAALDELTKIFQLGPIYDFQK